MKKARDPRGIQQRAWRISVFWVALVACILLPTGCTCATSAPPPHRHERIACRPQHPTIPTVAPAKTGAESVVAGGLPGKFSVGSTGDAGLVLPLRTPPGRAGVEPTLALTYDSSGGDGVFGVGFSLSGPSSITRCPSTLAREGEIRGVRYDAKDRLCLDGKPLVVVSEAPGTLEYRTVPDTFVRVIGRDLDEDGAPSSFEVTAPTGLVTEYGTSAASRPRASGGAPRAWLAAVTHDGRGNALSYGYCFADAPDFTAEYALDEIRYTRFDGSNPLEATRAVKLVLGAKDPADIRTLYSGDMALQSSVRVEEIQMVGPGEALVRRYALSYATSPTTSRTLLTEITECAGDGTCLPPTHFQYKGATAGFLDRVTTLATPTARKASPMLLDIDGDGLDDLVVPDTDKALSTPQHPLTQWVVAHNEGKSGSPVALASPTLAFSQDETVVDSDDPADPTLIQPELGTVIDEDQDGRKDVLLHDVYGVSPTWKVLRARPDRTFEMHDTGILRPFPVGAAPAPPMLTGPDGSMHLADVNGDHVLDLIQCDDHGTSPDGDPSKPVWTLHLWRPAQGADDSGFDPVGEPIGPLSRLRCDLDVQTVDLDGDGKTDLLFPPVLVGDDGSETPAATYDAISRSEDGSWEGWDTLLSTVGPGGRALFVDVNGDGLPDAVVSGSSNHALYTYMNTGPAFAEAAVLSLGDPGLGGQDAYFQLATTLDYDGDGRQDVLLPLPAGSSLGAPDELPRWVVLRAKPGSQDGATFTLEDPHIPFEAALGDAITLSDPHGPRVGDLNGDGASDVLLPLGGALHVFEGTAADPDVLVALSDGMNAHDPTDPDHVPSVAIAYGHLIDAAITSGLSGGAQALERELYLSRADASNDCAYPRRCAVGSRRVVRDYSLDDGAGGVRRFEVRYRDGRYDVLGNGFLGFEERILLDADTQAVTVTLQDNVTYDKDLRVFPFAGQARAEWRVSPGLPDQPHPEQTEMSFLDISRTWIPTHDGKTYFVVPTASHLRRAEGDFAPNGATPTVLSYARKVESGGGGASLLRDTWAKVTDVDNFGNVRAEDVSTTGVDLAFHVERTFKNDTDRWVLGQLETERECSTAAMQTQCRTLTRTTTIHGDARSESIATDDGSPETKLDVVYERDDYGNVTTITADDAFGHHRVTAVVYDEEGIFPREHVNAAGHTWLTDFDPGLGALTRYTDPNGLVTEWQHDGFGRVTLERRPDGTQAVFDLTRIKDGGPDKSAWRVRQRTTVSGGEDDEIELDSLGRPRVAWWHGPATPRPDGEPPRVMQVVVYDPRSGQVARRSVPGSELTAEGELLFEDYEYDALGREVRRKTPWNAVTETLYDGLFVEVHEPQKHVTIAEHDALGRRKAITDAALGVTSFTYGPFGGLDTTVDPGGALSRTTRDALGRVRKVEDPDRGTTVLVHDGFGELVSSTDALGREITFELDALGRTKSRVDVQGADTRTTTWAWDTAEHGIGKLHRLTSPDAEKTYEYNELGRLTGTSLAIAGESPPLVGKVAYDAFGRVMNITYPSPTDGAPFVVAQDHDAYGHVLTVRDAASDLPYWRLTDVDDAGRPRSELLGNGVRTERSYSAARQRLESIVTKSGASTVQSLAYEYDSLLNLVRRTDTLQPEHPTERFRYDALERLTCAYFSIDVDPAAPCASSYEYAPNGNLTFKSDVGVLAYGDPAHPHAVTAAESDSFGYDAVGHQTARPGGVKVVYTPFDLPESITEGAKTVTFGYDGDEQRIRKTTPLAETVYFGDLYERVTAMGSALTEHRYFIHSPERVIAVVTRGGIAPGTVYVHADHLGSVDALTGADGKVVERRSYDAFGQRRNPLWGEPPPPSFAHGTTLGFTGHEDEDELGLVNMKGRVFDPRLGRFLTTDPMIADLSAGQALNPYSYVLNNPLTYVDPSGFQAAPEKPPILPVRGEERIGPDVIEWNLDYPPRGSRPKDRGKDTEEKVGVAVPATDVDTTGSHPADVPGPDPEVPEKWSQDPYVQIEGGFFGGLGLGIVPFAGAGQELLTEGGVLPRGSPEARRGLAVGQILGGIFTLVGGLTGEVLGGAASVTGIGAAVGVPAMVVSTTLVIGGAANILAGLQGLMQSTTTGSGSGAGASPPEEEAPKRGGDSAAAAKGRQVHEEFKAKVRGKGDEGWRAEPHIRDPITGRDVVPDAVTPKGNPVELKPDTPSGRAAGRRQMLKYERVLNKKGRVIYYKP